MDRVKGKTVLITGGSRGIGASTAKELKNEGANVVITDILDKEGEKLANSIGAIYHHLDVSSEEEWQKITEILKKQYGCIDILFNNAGINGLNEHLGPQDPEHASLESWKYIHKINLESVFLGCKHGISLMKERGGSIINMSSRSGLVGVPDAAAYASTKAAIHNFTKSVALYCAEKKYSIRCNSIHPAAILTPIWDSMLGSDSSKRKNMINQISSGIPMGHMGEPIDVALAVLFFGSDESKFITGTELVLDGGILAGSSAGLKKKNKSK